MSPYFQPENADGHTYYCPNCDYTYWVPPVASSCCVLHSPGSCCHYGETKIAPITPHVSPGTAADQDEGQ